MKAFVASLVAMVVVALIAWAWLGTLDWGVAAVHQSPFGSVRL